MALGLDLFGHDWIQIGTAYECRLCLCPSISAQATMPCVSSIPNLNMTHTWDLTGSFCGTCGVYATSTYGVQPCSLPASKPTSISYSDLYINLGAKKTSGSTKKKKIKQYCEDCELELVEWFDAYYGRNPRGNRLCYKCRKRAKID